MAGKREGSEWEEGSIEGAQRPGKLLQGPLGVYRTIVGPTYTRQYNVQVMYKCTIHLRLWNRFSVQSL